jgi:hypothetical protein
VGAGVVSGVPFAARSSGGLGGSARSRTRRGAEGTTRRGRRPQTWGTAGVRCTVAAEKSRCRRHKVRVSRPPAAVRTCTPRFPAIGSLRHRDQRAGTCRVPR